MEKREFKERKKKEGRAKRKRKERKKEKKKERKQERKKERKGGGGGKTEWFEWMPPTGQISLRPSNKEKQLLEKHDGSRCRRLLG